MLLLREPQEKLPHERLREILRLQFQGENLKNILTFLKFLTCSTCDDPSSHIS